MARFARASGNEPLMKLERPTPASSQCTAHLINAAFSDVLSAKPHDPIAVNNLAVSKRGESNYHDTFVDHLTTVSDEYSERLALLLQLEKHLVQARAKALADDEKSLAAMTDMYPGYNELNLPKGPSHFRQHLDEELLARNHLLVPSKYLPAQPEHYKPPQETAPSYLNSTLTAFNRACKASSLSTDTVAAKKQHTKPVWQNTLAPEEREAEKIGLSNFNQTANFLRNSRYSKTKWSNTASSGPVKLKQNEQEPTPSECVSFIAEPEVVKFTDYSVGNTYETILELKNISAASRQLRLVPLSSPYFKVTPIHCPTSDGLVAPGLASSYLVSFTPDSLANYQTELKFLTCNDGEVAVQLSGFRPSPVLNIPAVLEVGYCLAGGRKTCVLECVNTGGEGAFTLTHPSTTDSTDETPSCELTLGPFTVSPVQFHLPANDGVVPLTLSFAPDKGAGEYLEEFSIVCDNGQTMGFSIRGVAQKLSVGCVSTGENSAVISDEDDPTATVADCSAEKLVLTPALNFEPVNPYGQSTATIVVKNFTNVELPYHWRFYRPITESPPWKKSSEDTPLVNKLVPSDQMPFSAVPCNGTLVAKETKKFTFNFAPTKTGCFVDMGYLVLSGVEGNDALDEAQEESRWLRLSQSEVAVLCVELTGEAKDYNLKVTPPALLIPYRLPLGTDTKKQVKLSNHSLAAVYYQWSKYECETASVTVDPPHGHIAPGGHSDFEVCIHAAKGGLFSTTLLCNLENRDITVPLYISGQVQGPVVSVSVPCLEFGLIPVGRTNTVSFRVNSHTSCSLSFSVRQLLEGDRDGFIDIPCLTFSPAEGELIPHGSATVSVECMSPGTTGSLRTLVQLIINGEPILLLWAFANLQRPQVSISPSYLQMEKCYVGIEASREVELSNRSPVPAQFTWSSRVCGEGVRVCVSPMTGRVGPLQVTTVTIKTTWNETSPLAEAILCCDVLNMERALFLQLSAEVLGLSVSFSEPLRLDFGCSMKLGVPVSKILTVTNTSGIPATLEANVVNFPSATPPTPPSQPNSEDGVSVKSSRGRALLSRTSNLLEKSTKQAMLAAPDCSSLLLREGRGCCFVVEPPSTKLPPFTPVTLTLTAHSDMWGEYTDQLICKVPGLSDTVAPISYKAMGCPIVFLSTATVGYTLARLGSHAPGANPVRRVIKVKNTSPVAIRVNWKMFNIVQNDDKYVDLLMAIGDPFPKASGGVLGSAIEPTTQARHQSRGCAADLVSRSESFLLQADKSLTVDEPISRSESKLDAALSDDDQLPCSLITAFIKPHEGVPSTDPFDIHPKEIVLQAHGLSSVEVVFRASVKALNEIGPNLASYALGYCSLDDECPANVTRKCGYDVDPLRIDILADIEHTRLSLCSDDDNGVDFLYPASALLRENSSTPANETRLTHHFTLLNETATLAVFNLATLTPRFTVSSISLKKGTICDSTQCITLKPQKSISFDISLTVSLADVRQSHGIDSLSFTDTLQVCYATGALQEFSLSATIHLPQLSLSMDQIDFKTTHIDSRPALVTLLISNASLSHALWELQVPSELCEVVRVEPECGFLPLHLSEGKVSTKLIRVTFNPKLECHYTGVLRLREVLTDRELTVALTGQGSADEKYIPILNRF